VVQAPNVLNRQFKNLNMKEETPLETLVRPVDGSGWGGFN